jgi:hypothetical protein
VNIFALVAEALLSGRADAIIAARIFNGPEMI